jgi:hypothetical protein
MNDFLYSYQLENRSIIEQVLHLSCENRQKLYKALRINALEQNKYYNYQFLFDNCSTRLRDIVVNNTEGHLVFKRILPVPPPTFRNMIHEYLNRGGQYWSKLGIDLLLGSKIDRKVKNEEAMFLPDYLMKGFDSALIDNVPLIATKRTILKARLPATIQQHDDTSPSPPLLTTFLLLLTGGLLTFIKSKKAQNFLEIFDVALFLIIGALGCLILFMWFGTDHELCRSNYNIIWALPTHLPVAFFLLRKKKWVKQYLKICAILYLLILIAWSFLPQGMNNAFLPLVLLAGIRSFDRFRKM